MPQMSPIMWETMMICLFVTLLVLVSKFYFYFNLSKNEFFKEDSSAPNKLLLWKW